MIHIYGRPALRFPHTHAGRRTKFASVKSLNSSEFSSEFSDLKTLLSDVKVNPVMSWNGHNSFQKNFPSNSQDFTTPQISFEFSGFYYTLSSFLIKPLHTNDRKTCPFREILSMRKGRGEDRVESCGQITTKDRTQIIQVGSIWFRVRQRIALSQYSLRCRKVTEIPSPLKWLAQTSLGAFPFTVWKNWRWGNSWIHSTTQRKEHNKTEFEKRDI